MAAAITVNLIQRLTEWWNTDAAAWAASMAANFEKTFITDNRYMFFINGLGNTLKIAAMAVLLGIVIGVIVAVVKVNATEKHSKLKWLDKIFGIYIAVIRGTPVVVQLMIMYYIILKNVESTIVVAVLAFGINSGAYVAEIVRAGIMSVHKGQMEAGSSLGLSRGQTLRMIVVPQAMRVILPPLTNQYLNLTKNSTLAVAIGYPDLFSVFAGTTLSQTGQAIEIISITMGVYLLISLVTSAIMSFYGWRLDRSMQR